MKLLPNTIDGLTWGISNFDGIEFDIRLTKDLGIVIYHDAQLENGELISDLTLEQVESYNIPSFYELLDNEVIVEQTNKGKSLWIELKPNCVGKNRITKDIATQFYSKIKEVLDNSSVNQESIRFISFATDLIDPIAIDDRYPAYPLIPDVNECNPNFVLLKALPGFFYRSLTWHINKAKQRNYAGILFARQYLMGWMSLRHPSYKKMVELMDEYNIELGTNLGSVDLETKYPMLHRFSDKVKPYPRHKGPQEGEIIAHRGTGTKGVEIS